MMLYRSTPHDPSLACQPRETAERTFKRTSSVVYAYNVVVGKLAQCSTALGSFTHTPLKIRYVPTVLSVPYCESCVWYACDMHYSSSCAPQCMHSNPWVCLHDPLVLLIRLCIGTDSIVEGHRYLVRCTWYLPSPIKVLYICLYPWFVAFGRLCVMAATAVPQQYTTSSEVPPDSQFYGPAGLASTAASCTGSTFISMQHVNL